MMQERYAGRLLVAGRHDRLGLSKVACFQLGGGAVGSRGKEQTMEINKREPDWVPPFLAYVLVEAETQIDYAATMEGYPKFDTDVWQEISELSPLVTAAAQTAKKAWRRALEPARHGVVIGYEIRYTGRRISGSYGAWDDPLGGDPPTWSPHMGVRLVRAAVGHNEVFTVRPEDLSVDNR